ncbi:MAG: hypothetical protein K9J84_13950, partial [Bacteroidia bacterium]|nr:hypothetical protein [Bacteroidia bacterium]
MKVKITYQALKAIFCLNLLFLLGSTQFLYAIEIPKSGIQFTENKGQWEAPFLFKADIPIGNLFIEKDQLTYLFVDKEATHEMQHGKKTDAIHFHSVKVKFLDANPNSTIIKDYKSEAYYNFFVGEQKFWKSEVYAYKKLTIKNLYPQIDLEILAQPDGIKLNFILGVGADPNKIKVQYDGADKLFLKNNQLHVQTSLGELLEESPFSFQMKDSVQEMIDTKYQLTNNILTYKLDRFNPKEPLVIDPAVVFGTYAGSAADNFGFAASFDNLGNAYGAGTVYAANFPYTAGAFDVSFNGGSSDNNEYARDAFIMKFNPNGSSLIFGTFIGGSDNEQPHSVTFYNNEIIVFGTTNSGNFPVTNNAFDKTYNGGSDLFVLKLNGAGSILNGSTFIGGTQDDGINGEAHFGFPAQTHSLPYNYADWYRGEVITDLVGNIYVSTCTRSNQSQAIPLINSAQTSYGGGFQDGYFVKLNNSLSNIIFSTFIGGSGNESAYSVCINNLNEPIIGGGTTSANLPFGSSNFPYSGDVDGFIAKYSSSGSLVRVIYTGTGFYDQIFFVQTDEQNNIYAMGQTKGNMPRTLGTYGVNNAKQFLQKYNSSLTSLLLSTTFGKPGGTEPSISPSAFLVDVCGRVYVSGWGGGTNTSYHNGMDNVFGLPTTSDAFQKSTDGSDFYLMALSPNFGTLLYATFYGGIQSQEHVDGGTSHFDKSGIVYQAVCAGCGGLDDFPTTSNAYSRINPGKRAYNTSIGGCNLGLFKFDMRTYILAPTFKDTVITIIAGSNLNYQFTANDAGGDNLTINFNSEVLNRTVNPAKITINGNSPGIINATLNWSTQCSDFGSDTIVIDVNVLDDACPLPNEVNGTIKIVLISEPIGPPYPDCIGVLDDNTLKLKWINGTPNSDFLNYQLYRKINDEPMVLFDSINNQLSTTYQDSKTPNILTTNYCYQILSLNSCRRAGDSSRV